MIFDGRRPCEMDDDRVTEDTALNFNRVYARMASKT